MADTDSDPCSEGHEEGESRTALNSHSSCKFSDVDDSLCLPDPVIHRDVAPSTDCIEMLKMMYENDDHIRVICLVQNAGESAVQSMDDVKNDPCMGFLLAAHCCHISSPGPT